ncbi:hypothetical protein ACFL14_00105 [Patescibacteria group bacterium]
MPKKKARKKTSKKATKKVVHKQVHKKSTEINEISWRSPEWAHHTKGIVWWIGFFLFFSTLIAVFYYLEFWWGIAFVLLLTAVIFVHSFRKPREILCKIDHKGVKIGTRFFEWQELISFWFVPNMPYTLLYLRSTNKLISMISIEVPIPKTEGIFKLLSKRIAMEERGEIAVDKLTRFLRF